MLQLKQGEENARTQTQWKVQSTKHGDWKQRFFVWHTLELALCSPSICIKSNDLDWSFGTQTREPQQNFVRLLYNGPKII